jgi:hypothetical protein
MRFNLGEVWRSVDAAGGEPRRAVVVAIEDDGRRGTLFFEDDDEQSVLWAQFTQLGRWQVDHSSKAIRGADELKDMILRKMRRHPICPDGMSLEITHTSGDDWEAIAVPPNQNIAYADCAHYIATVATALRSLYGVRLTRVEATTGLSFSLAAEPSASTAPSIVELSARATTRSAGSANLDVNRATQVSSDLSTAVATRLSESPTEIRDAARALSKAVAEQIAQLNESKPNDPDRLAQHLDFVSFLEKLAAGLDNLADMIDRAVAEGSAGKPEPVLLGKAGELARGLGGLVVEALQTHRASVADWSIKFPVLAAGAVLLHALGVPISLAAILAAGVIGVKLPKGDDSKG